MGAFVEKLWVRVLALILFFLFSAAACVGLHFYRYGLEDGWYGKKDYTFADSNLSSFYVSDAMDFVLRNLRWLQNPYDTTLGGYAGPAFAYVIKDEDGHIYADTTTENSYRALDGYDFSLEIYDTRYSVSAYLNLPVEPYGGCYREYYIFTELFSLRQYFLPVGIVMAVLAAAVLGVFIAGAARLGKRGKLTVLGRLPLDGAAAASLVLIYLISTTIWSNLGNDLDLILVLLQIWQGNLDKLLRLWAAAMLLQMLVNQLLAHAFTKKLLLRKVLRNVPPGTVLLAGLGVHLLILLMLLMPYVSGYVIYDVNLTRLCGVLLVLDAVALVCAILWAREQKRVRQATSALANGELNYKLKADRLHFVWRDMGQDLNRIGDGMAAAVEERIRSERMKTELITNVSHDLKTPLTSIINYIALLKEKNLSPEAEQEYLDVLDRQSAKLKKLTEDVVEASKAASGVIPVHAELLDVGELLSQSVGEYAERLTQAEITPVIHAPQQECYIMADGRLLGRVLDNLITNIVKYAQPGTRAYFDLAAQGSGALIALKNTSRAPLDIPADELMERFVRGDSSRSTEGSGLGLSIARSLTELMGGQLQLTLDGDFFKAEVLFPLTELPGLPAQAAAENTAQQMM